MKPLLTFLLLLGSLAILANDGTVPAPAASATGRFQIVLGYSTSPEMNGDTEHRRMFRIDTATGETWCLSTVPLTGIPGAPQGCTFDMWQRVQESGSDLHNVAMKNLAQKSPSK